MLSSFRWQVFLMLMLSGFHFHEKPEKAPLFFAMEKEWQEANIEKEIFTIAGRDTLINHSVKLLFNDDGKPRLFFCNLETPVCADGECRLAKIKVYWNLLGNYVGFGIYQDDPLTKNDHDPFDKDDYNKLHRLFLDNNSVLRRKTMHELVDKVPIDPKLADKHKDVDGMSSATKKDIADAVVKGGLYSCYTLWHLIHGEAKEKMKSYLKSIESDSLNTYFLYSEYKDYQGYALEQLSKEAFGDHAEQIGKIFIDASPITRTYILKKTPKAVLSSESITEVFYNLFPEIDINSRTLLIQKLESAHQTAPFIVSEYLPVFTKNQLISYLNFFRDSSGRLTDEIKSKLLKASSSPKMIHGHVIRDFLASTK